MYQIRNTSPRVTKSSTSLGEQPYVKNGIVIPNRVFVGGIPSNTKESELRHFFSAYGEIKDTKIISDSVGTSKGYGFVTFESSEDAKNVIEQKGGNLVLKGKKLNIGQAIRKHVRPVTYDPSRPGTIAFAPGVQHPYQDGMTLVSAPGGYAMPQGQQPYSTAMVMPRASAPMYLTPQYQVYQPAWAGPSSAGAPVQVPTSWQFSQTNPGQTAPTASGHAYTTLPQQPDVIYGVAPSDETQMPMQWVPASAAQPAAGYGYAPMPQASEMMYVQGPPMPSYQLSDGSDTYSRDGNSSSEVWLR